jgi:hypothetical protein
MKLTEVKSTKFTFDDSENMENIIKKINSKKSDKETKLTLGAVMRDATLKEFKKLAKQI